MKAVVLTQHGGPERLAAIEDVALPVPGPSEALIAVRACGVCFFDVLCRQGRRSRTKMPVILGHEIAGEIVAVGAAVTGFTVGDRVVCTGGIPCGECGACRRERGALCERSAGVGASLDGGYAEYVKLPASGLCRIPDGVSPEQASIVSCAVQTPYTAIVGKAVVRPGETVL